MNDLSVLEIVVKNGEARFEVHARPNARRSAIVGTREGALDVLIAARPVDGAANEELVSLLSEALEVRRSDVTIVRGEGARAKRVAIRGIDETTLRSRLVTRTAGGVRHAIFKRPG